MCVRSAALPFADVEYRFQESTPQLHRRNDLLISSNKRNIINIFNKPQIEPGFQVILPEPQPTDFQQYVDRSTDKRNSF